MSDRSRKRIIDKLDNLDWFDSGYTEDIHDIIDLEGLEYGAREHKMRKVLGYDGQLACDSLVILKTRHGEGNRLSLKKDFVDTVDIDTVDNYFGDIWLCGKVKNTKDERICVVVTPATRDIELK